MTVTIADKIRVGQGEKLLIIAGPCQLESKEHALKIATFLAGIAERQNISLVFKSSFDKANRTSPSGKRGLGINEGLRILQEIRSETGLPILTDIHSPEQAEIAGPVVDILQTPAFLCRQTDLLVAAGQHGKAVNIKKGQFLHPQDMQHAAAKVASSGNKNILLCERGASFGYRDLVVDMRSLLMMKEIGYPVVFDATHSVQQMGGNNGSSGGSRQYVAALARAAAATGIDALFVECHEDPDRAPSDGPCMLPLDQVEKLIETIVKIRQAF